MSKLVYGRNTVLSSLNEGEVISIFVKEDLKDQRIIDLAKKKNATIKYMNLKELDKMSNYSNHQGVVAEINDYHYSSLDEIVSYSRKQDHPLILILDEIADPHNLGAILRSADAFNVDGIIMKNRNQVLVNATVFKVSTGAANYVKVAVVSNLTNAIKRLKDEGYWIYAADGSAKEDYSKQNYSGPTALVVGSEGFGISRLVLENSDIIIKIPMYGHVNSLNVSVATGILLSRIRNDVKK